MSTATTARGQAISLTATRAGLEMRTPYDPGFVTAFKGSVWSSWRQWDSARKVWVVSAHYEPVLLKLIYQHFGVQLPPTQPYVPTEETRAIRIDWIDGEKERVASGGVIYGYADLGWTVTFPEQVIKEWFAAAAPPPLTAGATLYDTLAVPRTATEPELRRAFRELAKRWHPDVCREPEAAERFKAVKAAFDRLADPVARRRYDAGLLLEASTTTNRGAPAWKPPVRCGLVLVDGFDQGHLFAVTKILAWEPVVNADGKTLKTTWPRNALYPLEKWT